MFASRQHILPAAALVLVLSLTACGGGSAAPTAAPSAEASPSESSNPSAGVLSSFTAMDLEGNTVDQSILEGHKLTMVNVWGTFCPPCKEEMPDLAALHTEYAEKGVQIVGIVSDVLTQDGSLDEALVEDARTIASGSGVTYTNLLPSQDLYGLLGQIYALPSTFFVDETGNQVGTLYMGAKDKDGWAAVIDELLEEVE
ncbi:MAG TPA: TlpA family protein disulfide reductase [Candidatus Flavonifractor merdigallinarum]|uniref:TlpA family protein disulfide reductase n=1 Tax=Candidatus Flavonifractor merdigallinarum TaxID=2838589 RepID=A0A9D1Y906_9FIRM|nr:TlpA family protein disulfide reductase [Candidatus Flavonifractor merdigallinarum]